MRSVWLALALAACGFPAPPNVGSGPAEITAFGFRKAANPFLSGDIDAVITGTSITATMPYSTDVTSLNATFTTSYGAEVTVDGVAQASDGTPNDFLGALTYSVSAPDYVSQDYQVSIAASGFGNPAVFPTSGDALGIAVGDLDGDGKPDVAVVGGLNPGVAFVFLNRTPTNGHVPQFTGPTMLAVGMDAEEVAIGDLNGDGKPDLVISDVVSDTVSVFLNSTPVGAQAPTFQPRNDFSVVGGPDGLAIGDLNGDGKPDVAVAVMGNNAIGVLLNSTVTNATAATFDAATEYPSGNGPNFVVIADINTDGKPDLVSSGAYSYQLAVQINGTTNGARPASFPTTVPFTLMSTGGQVATGDISGDGKPDLAVLLDNGTSITLINKTPSGTAGASFANLSVLDSEPMASDIAIGDVIGTSAPDVVVVAASSAQVSVFETIATAGSGQWALPRQVITGASVPREIRLADFNGDGLLDFVVSGNGIGGISVQLLQP